jgi:hypothetical protein
VLCEIVDQEADCAVIKCKLSRSHIPANQLGSTTIQPNWMISSEDQVSFSTGQEA